MNHERPKSNKVRDGVEEEPTAAAARRFSAISSTCEVIIIHCEVINLIIGKQNGWLVWNFGRASAL